MEEKKQKQGFHPLHKIKHLIKKVGTMNLILILVFAFFIWFNAEMLCIYRECASIPETYACAVIAATIGECGICGWIRTTKDKQQDRQWTKEDMEVKKEVNEMEDEG